MCSRVRPRSGSSTSTPISRAPTSTIAGSRSSALPMDEAVGDGWMQGASRRRSSARVPGLGERSRVPKRVRRRVQDQTPIERDRLGPRPLRRGRRRRRLMQRLPGNDRRHHVPDRDGACAPRDGGGVPHHVRVFPGGDGAHRRGWNRHSGEPCPGRAHGSSGRRACWPLRSSRSSMPNLSQRRRWGTAKINASSATTDRCVGPP